MDYGNYKLTTEITSSKPKLRPHNRYHNGGHVWPKTPKTALISEYLAADSSPDTSSDAMAIIDKG